VPMTTSSADSVAGGTVTFTRQGRTQAYSVARRRMYWRRRAVVLVAAAVVLSGVGWVAAAIGSRSVIASTSRQGVRARAVQLPTLVSLLSELTEIRGRVVSLPIPSVGQSAVYVAGEGLVGASSHEPSVPIASVTKIMTAVIVLKDHPLGSGSGPTFTMTAADHAAWIAAVDNGDSTLEVVARERLTERQMLEALMIPSADNIADYLARWDAGSIRAFVAKMNAMAVSLGLKHTHYADPAGLNTASESTATDQAVLGAYAVGVPGMISVEDHSSVRFPTGNVGTYNPIIGEDGVIGLKSGFTNAAQICLVTAAVRVVDRHSVIVIAVTLGQPSSLWEAGQIDLALVNATTSDLVAYTVFRSGEPVGRVVAGWSTKKLEVLATSSVTVVGWNGLVVKSVVKARVPAKPASGRGWKTGTVMGRVVVSASAGAMPGVSLKLNGYLSAAPAGWLPTTTTRATTTTTRAASTTSSSVKTTAQDSAG